MEPIDLPKGVPEAGGVDTLPPSARFASDAPDTRSYFWTVLGIVVLGAVMLVIALTRAGTQVERLLDTVGYGSLSSVTTGSGGYPPSSPPR